MNNELDRVHLQSAGHQSSAFGAAISAMLNDADVKRLAAKAESSGIPYWQIISAVDRAGMGAVRGKPVDKLAILAAIESLIPQPQPAPVPAPPSP